MFASKTPEQAGFEPRPWRYYFSGASLTEEQVEGWENRTAHVYYDPTNQWYGLQHNEPNPILLEFRIGWRHNIDRRLHAQHYLTYLDGDVYDWRHFSPEVFDHARRVLSKLTALRA